ncbi:MAG: RidA family protein [Flavobacteriales bacterium]|nr:RidA family protein [Flavobacteriales bacterium]
MKTSIISVLLIAMCVMSCTSNSDNSAIETNDSSEEKREIQRQAINPPDDWGAGFEMNQAELISDFSEMIKFSGQTSLVPDTSAEMGLGVKYPGDQRKQMEFILNAIDDLLKQAGMERKDIIHVNFYTTDMEGLLGNYDVYATWIKEAGIRPTQSAIGVAQLVSPDMKLEIEVTGAR